MSGKQSKPPLLVLVGPTAVGKTEVAIELALLLGGEVVGADSMQIYRGMDIGTAKPRPEERRGVPHHLIDVVDPGTPFNVATYRRLATAAIAGIHLRGALPILCGGTGLYIKAVLGDFLFPDEGALPELRRQLEERAQHEGAAVLHAELAQVDPETAARLHPNDIRRVIRALEVYKSTGEPLSVHLARQNQPGTNDSCPYQVVKIGLVRRREELYERINRRVIWLVENGLLEETKRLMDMGFFSGNMKVAAQAIGYKEMYRYLTGEISLEQAIADLQKATRRYAKRQLTWFRSDKEIRWFDMGDYSSSSVAAEAIAAYARPLLWPD
ncbi:MAG TPA: tRNA (adenosine(37)-N6)-dimethylallyltransferase MiaA [Firmicutes bacterium]|nr:tRNA (adenosine(37)-N6)-dimethylallyltransferase MiaA [Bacillota bacterium]